MNTFAPSSAGDAGTEDILFECPQCGKSLEIDARLSGTRLEPGKGVLWTKGREVVLAPSAGGDAEEAKDENSQGFHSMAGDEMEDC